MSRTIDERVVEMRFDNKQFETNAGKTMSTLEKLKNALNFRDASDGLDKLGRAVNNVNMNPLANGVEAVRKKFSALEVMAVGSLLNISNKITDAATSMAKLLTIDQISAGWDKYAEKTSAVQTIMAATAQDFEDTSVQMEYVNAQLEKLNWFTDETSYNFVDMVSNIGKFTSNNIALEDSVTSMQGIATWAAISGANAGEASRAMYNLAQAIATGSVKLIDWKSIENANMATAGFKETVLETAASMGTLRKTADGVYQTLDKGTEVTVANFNSALSEGWFTSEVLLSTLDQYGSFTNKLYEVSEATGLTATEMLQWMDTYRDAGENSTKVIEDMSKKTGVSVSELTDYLSELTDETYALGEKAFRAAQEAKTFQEAIEATKDAVSTGWMKTWEIIFGDYEKAKVRWTALANELYDVFAAGAEARNELLTEALDAPKRVIEKGGWYALAAQVKKAGVPVDDFIDKLTELGDKAGAIDASSISGINDFVASLEDGWLTVDMITEAIDSFIGPLSAVDGAIAGTTKTFEDFKDVVAQAFAGEWGNGIDRINAFTEAGWNAAVVQHAMNKAYDSATGSYNLARITVEDFTDAVLELTEAEQIQAGYTSVDIEALKTLRDEYAGTGKTLDDMRSGSELLFDGVSQGWNAIKGIFSAMKQGWEIAFPTMTADRLYNILKAFNSLATSFNEWVGNFEDYEDNPLSQTVISIKNTFAGLGSIIGIGLDALKAFAGFIRDTFGKDIGKGVDRALDFTGTIGDFLVNLREWLQANDVFRKGLDQMYSAIQNGAGILKDWFADFKELPWVQEQLGKLANVFDSFTGFISSSFPKATEKVRDLLSAFQNMWKNKDFSGITSSIRFLASALKIDLINAWAKLKRSEFFSLFADGIKMLWNLIKEFDTSGLTSWAKTLYESVVNFIQPVIDFFKNGRQQISDAITGFGNGIRTASETLEPITNFLSKSFGKIIGLVTLYAGVKLITNFVKTVSTLGEKVDAAIKLVTKPLDAFTGVLTSLKNTINSFQGVAKAAKTALNALALLEVVAAIGGLAFIIAQVGKVPDDQLKRGAIVVGGIAIVVMAILGLLTLLNNAKAKIDPVAIKKKSNDMLRVLELSAAVFLLCSSFLEIYSVIKDGHALAAIFAVGGVITAIAIALGSLSVMNKIKLGSGGLKGSISSFLSLIAITKALKLIVSSFSDLYVLLSGKDWAQLKGPILGFGVVVAALVKIMASLSKMEGVSAGTGIGILGTVFSLKVLVSALKDIGDFDLKTITNNFGSYILVFGTIFILMRQLSKMSGTAGSAGVGLLAVSAAIGILAVVIRMIGGMELASITKGTIAVGAMLTFMGLFAKLANDTKIPLSTAATFLAVSVAVGILAAIVAVLSLLDPKSVAIATACVDSMVLMMALIAQVAKGASDIKVGPLLTLLVAVGALSGALVLIISIADDQESIKTAALALDSLMVCFALIAAASKLAQNSAASIFVIGLVVGGLAGILYLLAENTQNTDGALKCAEAISLILVAMSIALLAAGVAAPLAAEALLGITGMIVIVGILGVLCGLVGSLIKDHPSIMEDMDRGIALANKIGEFIGAFVGGIIEGVTASFESVGTHLSKFAENASPFFDKMSAIGKDSSIFDGVTNLANALLSLTGSSLIDGIASFFGAGIEDFSSKLNTFAEAMVTYSNKITADGGINAGAVAASAMAGEALASLVQSIPKTGGIWQKIAGASDLDELSGKIVAYADAITAYNDKVKGKQFDTTAIENSASAASGLVDLINNLPAKDGWKQKIFGDPQGLDTFGESLGKFGSGLYALVNGEGEDKGLNALSKDDIKSIGTATEAAKMLVELQAALPEEDGWLTKFFGGGQTDLSEFGSQLATFGEALTGFSGSISDVDNLSSIITQVNRLVFMLGGLSTLDIGDMTGLSWALKTLADYGITDFCTAFEDCTEQVQAAVNSLANAAVDAAGATEVVSKFLTAGETSSSNYITGLQNNLSLAFTTGIMLQSNAITGMSDGYEDAQTQGSNIGSGFAAGILGWGAGAYNAAYSIGRSAISGLQRAIDAHSPSREAAKLGDYTGVGYVDQLLEYASKAYNAGGDVGSAALNGINKAISEISNVFNDDAFMSPVIRPVVDLTDAQKSVTTLNGLFNRSIGIAIDNASAVSRTMSPPSSVVVQEARFDDANANGGNTYQFIQNNNSPKALSRYEIYRSTKNQFKQFKEAMDKT